MCNKEHCLWFMVTTYIVFLLHVLDYVLTFKLTSMGYYEINPLVPVHDVYLFSIFFLASCLFIFTYAYMVFFFKPFTVNCRLTIYGKIVLSILFFYRAAPVIHNLLLLLFNYESPFSTIFYEIFYKNLFR